MIPLSKRRRALTLVSAAGLGLSFCGPQAALLNRAAAQSAEPSSTVAPVPPAGQSPESVAGTTPVSADPKGRHLAPHDTFYILSYVSVTTDTGVEGFVPGQEVHLVSVNRPAHTLVVTDGKAQVELPPAKLTNDLDIAALVRRQDQANQERVAAYVQAEEAAFAKREREQAEESAKIDERQREQAQVAQAQATAQAQDAAGAQQPVDASPGAGAGYYDSGGYGYGSPYSYFFGEGGANRFNRGGTGPGGGRGTIPSDNAATANTDVQRGATSTGAGAGGAHPGGGGGHPGGGGGGKP